MRARSLILGAVLALSALPAAAQTHDELWDQCGSQNADVRIGGCTGVIQSGRETNANLAIAFIKRGLAYGWKGDHQGAIKDCSEAMRLDPSNSIAYYNRGNTYRTLGQTDRAIRDFDQAIALNPSYGNAYFNRGLARAAGGQHAQAVQDFDRVLRLEPTATDATKARCTSLKALGRAC